MYARVITAVTFSGNDDNFTLDIILAREQFHCFQSELLVTPSVCVCVCTYECVFEGNVWVSILQLCWKLSVINSVVSVVSDVSYQ